MTRAGDVAFCEHGVAVGFGCSGCTEVASVEGFPQVTIETDAGESTLTFAWAPVGDPAYTDVAGQGPWFQSEAQAEVYGAHLVLVGNWRSFTVTKRYFSKGWGDDD